MSDSLRINTPPMVSHTTSQAFQGDEAYIATHPWVRHYETGVPAHIDLPDQPLSWLLDNAVRRYPHHTAFIYYGRHITYTHFFQAASRFASELHRLGVQKGDRVALSLPNIPQYAIAFYGALKAGAVVVPTNPLYTERELQAQLVDSGARVLVMLDTLYPIVRAVRKQTDLQHIIVTSAADFLPPLLRAMYPFSQRGTKQPQPQLTHKELHEDPTLHVMQTLLESHTEEIDAAWSAGEPVVASDLAVLQYTGGTTGPSKGAMLTHRNLLANAMQTRAWFPKARIGEEVMLCAAPFFHCYGMTVCMNLSLLLGSAMVLVPRFKAKAVVKTIKSSRPTIFPGIPTMYLALMGAVDKDSEVLSSIKFCISGAAPLPAQVQADFEAITHGKLVEGYGLSEAGPVTHANPLTDQCRTGSIGLPFPSIDAIIANQETGAIVPNGEIGEILLKGPNIMQGYWKRAAETKAALRDGWLHTGDLGKMDSDGYFTMVERVKDVIIASGFKVYPQEVEAVLFQHPAVAEAAVTGVPDAYRGETVAAFVVLKHGIEASEATKQLLILHCEKELAIFKVPKILEFRESLPKSLIGKVIRRQLHVAQATPTTTAVHRPGVSQ